MIAEQQKAMQGCLSPPDLRPFESSFPRDRRPVALTHKREQATVSLRQEAWSNFVSACDQEQIDPRNALIGLLQVLLHRYTVADSVGIGVHGWRENSFSGVSTDIDGTSSLRDNIQKASVAATKSVQLPEDVQTRSRERSSSETRPIFRVLLSVLNAVGEGEEEVVEYGSSLCDIAFRVVSRGLKAELRAEFESDLYTRHTIERILSQFQYLIESFEQVVGHSVNQLPLCSAKAVQSLLIPASAQITNVSSPQCLHRRFEEQAGQTPNAVALVMPGEAREEITYGQLNASANQLAHYLLSRGVGPDVLVGLYLDRTPDLLVALLAILKAGGAYLPIDLSYPPDRVSFMLSDADAPIIITDSRTARNLKNSSGAVIEIDTGRDKWTGLSDKDPKSAVTPDNLAYSIFTSGSTGKPKGVLITHANVSRLFDATADWFHFSERDAWTFFHSIAFDFSVWEIWGALLYGGRLVIVPFADSRSPERFHDLLANERVTVLNQTPSAFRQLIGVDESKPDRKLDQLKFVVFGGEALNLQSLAPWFNKYGDAQPRLVNMYGITETTVHVTYRPLSIVDLTEAPGSVIGIPIPDLRLYVLDAGLQPVPVGIPGEMFVGGAGVARGYLKRDSLTAERFINNPFSASGTDKLYRSGDLARRLPDGDLEYMGRADQQVKIRGFRVELGEVQSALTKQSSVREAFVTVKETCDGEKILVAYVVLASSAVPAVDRLRRDMQATLPSYMVPSCFVFLDRLPLTSNGKIDRSALPAAIPQRFEMEQPFQAPQTEMERSIAAIYKQVLRLDKVGIDDNFFDLGGNSLRLVEIHSRLQDLVGHRFSVAELFAYTTVRKLAALFSHNGRDRNAQAQVLDRAKRQRQAMSAGRDRRRQ